MPPHRALPEGSPEIASRRRARAGMTERARADDAAQVLSEFNSVGHALESLSMSWCGYGPLCGGIADYDGDDVARLRAVLSEHGGVPRRGLRCATLLDATRCHATPPDAVRRRPTPPDTVRRRSFASSAPPWCRPTPSDAAILGAATPLLSLSLPWVGDSIYTT